MIFYDRLNEACLLFRNVNVKTSKFEANSQRIRLNWQHSRYGGKLRNCYAVLNRVVQRHTAFNNQSLTTLVGRLTKTNIHNDISQHNFVSTTKRRVSPILVYATIIAHTTISIQSIFIAINS